jgi:hypothetical protein
MSSLDTFEENYYLYNLEDSIHSQHIGYLAFFTVIYQYNPLLNTLIAITEGLTSLEAKSEAERQENQENSDHTFLLLSCWTM